MTLALAIIKSPRSTFQHQSASCGVLEYASYAEKTNQSLVTYNSCTAGESNHTTFCCSVDWRIRCGLEA